MYKKQNSPNLGVHGVQPLERVTHIIDIVNKGKIFSTALGEKPRKTEKN